MVSFVITLYRFAAAILRSLSDPEIRAVLILSLGLMLSGAFFYRWAEGWSFLDALYFSVMTLATVGYGDLHPTTALSKVFTMVYVLLGIGVFVGLAGYTARALLNRPGRENDADDDTP